MRFLLAALAALLLAFPVNAKTLIVRCDETGAGNSEDAQNQAGDLYNLMDRRGGTFSAIPIQATRTEWMRTGNQRWIPNQSVALGSVDLSTLPAEQFDAVVVLGWARTLTNPAWANPCSLTYSAKWPTVPVVFIGECRIGGSKFTANAGCSTGVASNGGAYTTVKRTYVSYPVGSASVWRSMSVNLWPVVGVTQPAGITLRKIVAMNYSAVTPGGIPTASSLLRSDPDSTSFTGDSLVMWALYAPTITNAKPIIFVESGGSVAQDVGLIAMAMQMADSASGGNVWDKDGARPIELAFAVTATTSRGKYTNDLSAHNVSHLGGGPFCYADSCDTTNVLAGLDSLGTLSGLKTTFYVDPCSLSTYPSVKNWFSRAGKYRVGLQPVAGALSGATTAASSTHPADPFGRLRTRLAAIPTGACAAASDTVLTYCGLVWQRALVESYFPGLVDRSAYPAFGDWSPLAFTKLVTGPGVDSTAYAIWKAGIRTIVIRPEFINSNVSVTLATATNPGAMTTTTAATDPYGYFPEGRSIPVYADPSSPGRVIGRLKIVADRGQRTGPNVSYTDPSHDIRTEWFEGAINERWYHAPIRYFYHEFFTRTPVVSVSLGQLGGAATSTPARIGWWIIKHTANEVNVANNFGWVDANGKQRKVFEWVYVSDLRP